ncbi:extracellular solute-binding protein [Streptomyces tropicalis]|uniref:Uncharacterized protein n=1 Tax=Streptomyces tropicalis TaxID=3034234 RepID=A0ABT6ABE2_9ACTN|nr:extracellular solute-binding protein [Streptomyces tropicalis]MDF3301966.1 hypothetical protein [Streptomyces tropicalis]
MRAPLSRLVRLLAAAVLLLTACACGGDRRDDSVTIMVPWSGDEFAAFHTVVKSFEKDTGVHVNVQVTRALTQQLDAAVGAGAPPDLAILPSVGAISTYADRDKGLKPLRAAVGGFLQPFQGLTTNGGTTVYALPVKVDVKSLVWFRASLPGRPRDPAAVASFAAGRPGLWCLGLESGPTSGWPGADWIADLVLQNADGDGPYRRWLSGRVPWTRAESAWRDWWGLVGTGAQGASTKGFGEAARGMTTRPPQCSLAHGALSAMGFGPADVQDGAYDFVPSSTRRRLEVSADFVGKFTTGNPNADALATYLAGRRAQQSWVDQPGGYAFSANAEVTRYRNGGVQQRIADLLRPHSGYTLCFGAADAMAPDMSAAFYRAVLTYVGQKGADLPTLLAELDLLQRKLGPAGKSPVGADRLCAAT